MARIDQHDAFHQYVTPASIEPVPFPTQIVLRKQPSSAATEQVEEHDFTDEDLRQMLWDYASRPAPASDLAGLTKKSIQISCVCSTRVIKVTHELRHCINWEWMERVLFRDFTCFYCAQGYPAHLEAYRKTKAQWDEDSRSSMEKVLRAYMHREYSRDQPNTAATSIASMVDKTIARIKKHDQEVPPTTKPPPEEPLVPEPAWRRKFAGRNSEQSVGATRSSQPPGSAKPATQRAMQDTDTSHQAEQDRRAAVEDIEEDQITIEKNLDAEVLLAEHDTDDQTAGASRSGSVAFNRRPPGPSTVGRGIGKIDIEQQPLEQSTTAAGLKRLRTDSGNDLKEADARVRKK